MLLIFRRSGRHVILNIGYNGMPPKLCKLKIALINLCYGEIASLVPGKDDLYSHCFAII